MAQAFTPGLLAASDIKIRKVRELPLKGELRKRIGDSVQAEEIVAETMLPGDLVILRISEKMGIEPDEVLKALRVSQGSTISEGELVAEHKGLFGLFTTKFTSQCSGVVELISERTGHVGVRLPGKPISIDAYVDGVVVAETDGSSVTVESRAAVVQGIFGVGGEKRGILRILNVSPDAEITEADIPKDASGAVFVGGMRPTLSAIMAAASRGAVGLVTGSIDDRALAGYLGYDIGIALTGDEAISMTLILTEGFGAIAMAPRVIDLLRKFDGQKVSINGATQVRAGALRPEVIICHPNEISHGPETTKSGGLQIGSRIRIIRVPYFGMAATVVELPSALERIPTGSEARVLRGELQNGEVVTVPRANVEML